MRLGLWAPAFRGIPAPCRPPPIRTPPGGFRGFRSFAPGGMPTASHRCPSARRLRAAPVPEHLAQPTRPLRHQLVQRHTQHPGQHHDLGVDDQAQARLDLRETCPAQVPAGELKAACQRLLPPTYIVRTWTLMPSIARCAGPSKPALF
jgi:hypothetical protein